MFPIWLPVNAPGKSAEDGPSTWNSWLLVSISPRPGCHSSQQIKNLYLFFVLSLPLFCFPGKQTSNSFLPFCRGNMLPATAELNHCGLCLVTGLQGGLTWPKLFLVFYKLLNSTNNTHKVTVLTWPTRRSHLNEDRTPVGEVGELACHGASGHLMVPAGGEWLWMCTRQTERHWRYGSPALLH